MPFVQTVVDHRRDLRAVARDLRLALDHRGDRQQLVGRHVQGVGARDLGSRPKFSWNAVSCSSTSRATGAPLFSVVGRREQEAFEVRRAVRRAVVARVRAAASVCDAFGSCRSAWPSSRSQRSARASCPRGSATFTTTGAAIVLVCFRGAAASTSSDDHRRDHRQQRHQRRPRARAEHACAGPARSASASRSARGAAAAAARLSEDSDDGRLAGGGSLGGSTTGSISSGRRLDLGRRIDRDGFLGDGGLERDRRLDLDGVRGGRRREFERQARPPWAPRTIGASGSMRRLDCGRLLRRARGRHGRLARRPEFAASAAFALFAVAFAFLGGAFGVGRDRSPRAKTAETLTGSRREPALEEVRRRARVLARRERALHSLRHARGEALVVHLHRHALAEVPGEALGERARLACLLGVARRSATAAGPRPRGSTSRSRTSSRSRADAAPARRALDRLDRRDDRARRVAQRAAAARAAVVQREHAHVLLGPQALLSPRAPARSPPAPRVDRLAQLLRVAPAGLGHRVAAASPAAHDLRRDLDHLAGLHAALDQLGRHARHQVHAPVGGACRAGSPRRRGDPSHGRRRRAAPSRRRPRRSR